MHGSDKLIPLHNSKGLELSLACMTAIGGPSGEERLLKEKVRQTMGVLDIV